MNRSRLFVVLVDLLALAGVLFILLFPAITSMAALAQPQVPGGQVLAAGEPHRLLLHALTRSDSGAQTEAGAGLLRGFAFLAGALWLLRPRRSDRRLRSVSWCGWVFLALVLLSAITSTQVRDALAAWGDYLAMALCFAVAAGMAAEYRTMPVLQVGGLVIGLAIAMVLPGAWFIFAVNPDPSVAVFGAFYQPNMLAGYLLMALPLATVGMVYAGGNPRSQRAGGLLGGLVVAALGATLYFTYSRSAWALGLVGGLLPLVLVPRQPLARLSLRAAAGLVFLVGFGGACLAVLKGSVLLGTLLGLVSLAALGWLVGTLPNPGRLAARLVLVALVALALVWTLGKEGDLVTSHAVVRAQQLASGQDKSGSARLSFYRAALTMAGQHPLLGVGPEGFHRYYPVLQKDLRWFAKYAHSQTMTLLCETGIPATLAFYGAVLLAGLVWWRRAQADEDSRESLLSDRAARMGLGLGACLLLAHSQLDVDFHFLALPLTAALLAGLAVGFPSASEEVAEPMQEPLSEWSIRPGMLLQYLGSLALLGLLALNASWSTGEFLASQARVASDLRRDDLALDFYRAAIRWDPLQGEHHRQAALILLGPLFDGRGSPEIAKEALERSAAAVALDPHRAVTQSTRGRVLEVTGHWQEAEGYFRRALELDPVNFPSFYLDVARAMVHRQNREGAESFLLEALKRYPEDSADYLFTFRSTATQEQMAEVYLTLGLMARPGSPERMTRLEKASRLDPRSRQARFVLATERFERGRVLEAQGRPMESGPLFQQAAQVLQELYHEEPTFSPVGTYLTELRRRGYAELP